MKNISNKKGFSIVLAMGMTMVIGLIALLILEYIIPFSRNIKGVENSSAAFYQAYSGIEDAMWELSQNDVGYGNTDTLESSQPVDYGLTLVSNTSTIPPVGKGSSEYDANWNRFDNNYPIQLEINNSNVNFNQTTFEFRIPDIDENGDYIDNGTIVGNDSSQDYLINWIITGTSDNSTPADPSDDVPIVLNGMNNDQLIKKSKIGDGSINIGNKVGLTLNDDMCEIQYFIANNCGLGINIYDVTLKMSLVDALKLDTGQMIPYLEYKVEVKNSAGNPVEIPGRYSQIETSGKSYGYRKNLDIKVPQLSTNQAFDFAVFQ